MADYDYGLPERAVAQEPVEPRDAARLLVALAADGSTEHRHVRDLPDLLGPGDLLVVNDTRVLPARLRLAKDTGAAAEVLLLEAVPGEPDRWEALVRPSRRLPPGTVLRAPTGEELVEVGERSGEGGMRRVRLLADPWAFGQVPLPPYLHGPLPDPERYQTVYANRPASVAAPTAGLHLTDAVLRRCRDRGIALAAVELVVGLDTFRPVTVEDPADHVIHTEAYRVPAPTWEACRATAAAGGRVVAVGTTTVRALESVAGTGRLAGRTDLFVRPGHRFQVVDMLLTNFHLPRSTLLLLVEALAGERWRELYCTALAQGYRFLSFGDAMLVANRERQR